MTTSNRGAPKRSGILVRVPCRFENAEQYQRVISQLTIDRRGAILFDHATAALQTAPAARPARRTAKAKEQER